MRAQQRGATSGAFVSWVPSCGRSQGFIEALGLEPVYTSYLRQKDIVSAPLKYGPQFIATLRRSETPMAFAVLAGSAHAGV